MRALLTALVLLSSAVVGGASQAGADTHPVVQYGYVPVPYGADPHVTVGAVDMDDQRDGLAHLHFGLMRPRPQPPGFEIEKRPVVVEYQGYTNSPTLSTFAITRERNRLVEAGYNFLMVAARGAQCSEGVYQPASETEALDGAAVVEWAARQPWSNGQVALVGFSLSALTQFRVAAKRPSGLVAMVPLNPMTDFYRDALHPGGIMNTGLPAGFTAVQNGQQVIAFPHTNNTSPTVRERCARHLAQRSSAAENQVAVTGPQHPYLDDYHASRSAIEHVDEIAVPVFTAFTWQDGSTGSRGAEFLGRLKVDYRAIFTNGTHAVPGDVYPEVVEFLDHHVRGTPYDAPRVRVWWDRTSHLSVDTTSPPTWPTRHASETVFGAWPPPQAKPREFALTAGGMNVDGSPGVGAPDTYAYVPGSGQVPVAPMWDTTPPPGAHLEYTSPPLQKDLVVAGSGSVNLSMTSTAPDTDVQVVLTEVRDGTETYVKTGWLRASHRALAAESTALQPVHPHDEKTVGETPPLSSTTPAQLRVELPAFAHTFRAGSRLRLWVEAPNAAPGAGVERDDTRANLFSFASWPVPAANAVHHAGAAQSTLVLAEVPGAKAQTPAPPCGSLLGQPCRTALR